MFLAGCGTTRWSDTQRTATEQLLLSDAMDRAINRLDFRGLAGKTVYLDPTALRASVNALYLASSVRQQMMAHGCIVKDRREDADYVVEIRAGAIGTDHRELLFGVPATNMPQVVPVSTVPAAIPEVPLAKKTEQRAVAKIAVFAYNRETGRPVWQSGTVPVESDVRDVWVLGAGPFQRGGIVDARKKALAKKKKKQPPPLLRPGEESDGKQQFAVTDEAYFVEPVEEVARRMLRSDGSSQTNLAAPSGIRGPEFPSPPVGPGSGAAPGPGQKPPASPSPLDAVVPTANLDPGGFSSQPTSGMAGGFLAPFRAGAGPVAARDEHAQRQHSDHPAKRSKRAQHTEHAQHGAAERCARSEFVARGDHPRKRLTRFSHHRGADCRSAFGAWQATAHRPAPRSIRRRCPRTS